MRNNNLVALISNLIKAVTVFCLATPEFDFKIWVKWPLRVKAHAPPPAGARNRKNSPIPYLYKNKEEGNFLVVAKPYTREHPNSPIFFIIKR